MQQKEQKIAIGNRNYDVSLSFIQIICAIAVVTLHTNGCFWNFSATERYWRTANVIECVFYFAVPLFFMITGITLLDYQEKYSTRVYFIKRAKKTLLPYVAWSLIGIVFRIAIGQLSRETVSIQWVINGLLSTSGIINLYWFFQPLFCVYLCIPLFAAISKEKKKRMADYAILIGLTVNVVIPFINNIFHLGLSWPYSISAVSGYLFWIWAGYRIYYYPPTRKQKICIYIFAVIGLLTHTIGTYILSIEEGSIQSFFKGYNNLPCIMYSIGIFVLLRDVFQWIQKHEKMKRLIIRLGTYTFPLYLIHWFILKIIDKVAIVDTYSIIYRLFAPYLIYMIVIIITWCLRKIPGIKKIVP